MSALPKFLPHFYLSCIVAALLLLPTHHARAATASPAQQQESVRQSNRAELAAMTKSAETTVNAIFQQQTAARAALISSGSANTSSLQTLGTLEATVNSATDTLKDTFIKNFEATHAAEDEASREADFIEARIQRDEQENNAEGIANAEARLATVLASEKAKLAEIYTTINSALSNYKTRATATVGEESALAGAATSNTSKTDTLTISSPANGATVSGTVNVTGLVGTAFVNVRAYTLSGVALSGNATPSNGSYSLSFNSSQLPAGTSSIKVDAFSMPAGQVGGIEKQVVLQVNVQNNATFSVSSPANGATVSGTVNITGTAGTEWVNVRAYTLAGVALTGNVTPVNGSYALSLNTAQLPAGSSSVKVDAFSVPAGQAGGSETQIILQLNVANTTAVNGACGASNGTTGAAAPTSNLCTTGTSSSVTGSGPFAWNCTGSNGGTTAQCSAKKTVTVVAVNGACGSANGITIATAPTSNLCTTGTSSSVTGSGPFAWTCAGSNGGTTAQCSAQKTTPVTTTPPATATNGACGSANGTTIALAPSLGLCSTGSAGSVTGSGPWAWTCAGSNGGTLAQCSASKITTVAAVNGSCGASNGSTLSTAPVAGLCTTGAATSVTGSGPWNWSCTGSNGGTTATCLAAKTVTSTPLNASCGSSSGTNLASAPTANLCTTGAATSVTGSGPWNWSCTGSNGGITVQCIANSSATSMVNGACGSSNSGTFASKPSSNLCSTGSASSVSGSGPWSWTCVGAGGGITASCNASSEQTVNGVCGASNGTSLTTAPTATLCTTGTASSVSGSGPWKWTCTPPSGDLGSTASCSASVESATPPAATGTCGSASGAAASAAPTTNLCSAGTASTVSGSGPYAWTCSGTGGDAFCVTTMAVTNGACGSSSGAALTTAPTANLCSSGTASTVTGSGPWQWLCSTTTGSSATCITAPTSNGACGSENGKVVTAAPTTNLCTAGTVEGFGGANPYYWNCVGGDGGTEQTCATAEPTPPSSTGGRNYLNGIYTGLPTDYSTATKMKYPWDYTVNDAYQAPIPGGLPGFSGYPEITDVRHVNPGMQDFNAAANGDYNQYYTETAQGMAPNVGTLYATRIDSEFNGNWETTYPGTTVSPATWIAGFRQFALILKKYMPNLKIIWNPALGQLNPFPFYPGDDVVDLMGYDIYCNKGYTTSSQECWSDSLNGAGGANLTALAAFAEAHNKPIVFPEWGDEYGDGYMIGQMAAWMNSHNVVAHTYWDSDYELSYPASLQELTTNQAAYLAAFDVPYTGTYWPTILPIPTDGADGIPLP